MFRLYICFILQFIFVVLHYFTKKIYIILNLKYTFYYKPWNTLQLSFLELHSCLSPSLASFLQLILQFHGKFSIIRSLNLFNTFNNIYNYFNRMTKFCFVKVGVPFTFFPLVTIKTIYYLCSWCAKCSSSYVLCVMGDP